MKKVKTANPQERTDRQKILDTVRVSKQADDKLKALAEAHHSFVR